jgi:uncharacterized protein (TIGR00369 family)
MIIEEPVRGSFAYLEQPGLFALPGPDQIRLFIEGRLHYPPVHHLTGLAPVDAKPEASTWVMPASPWWQSAAGLFPGGASAFVADAALGTAIYTTLGTGMALATSELSLNFLRPATPASGTIIARGKLIHTGGRQGLSEARVEDDQGRLLTHATSRGVLQPLPFEPPSPPHSFPLVEQLEYAAPDPYLRPAEGEVVTQDIWNETGGLDLVLMWLKGERPLSPICHLFGWRLLETAEGSASWAMPASLWFCTAYGTFYGGVIALFADGAINTAVTTTLPPGTSFGTLDLKVNFLRPVNPDGRDLVARATVVQRGKTIAVTTAEIDDANGKRVAMATGSAMILPERPWTPTRPVATVDEALAEEAG